MTDVQRKGGLAVEKVKLSVELEPELGHMVERAATSKDQTVRQWVVNAIRHELEGEDDDEIIRAPKGAKPKGSVNPPRSRSGRTVADAVIEDRNASW
jgi:hypothetical protein